MDTKYRITVEIVANEGSLETEKDVEKWLEDLIRLTYIAEVTNIDVRLDE